MNKTMTSPEIARLEKDIQALKRHVIELAASNQAILRVLEDLSPTLSGKQIEIIRRHQDYKEQIIEKTCSFRENREKLLDALFGSSKTRESSPID